MEFEFSAGQEGQDFFTEVSSHDEDFDPEHYTCAGVGLSLSLEQVEALVNVVAQFKLECRRLGSGPLGMGDGSVLADMNFNIPSVFVGIEKFSLDVEGASWHQPMTEYQAKTCLCTIRDGGEQLDFSKIVATLDGKDVELLISFPSAVLAQHLELHSGPALGMR